MILSAVILPFFDGIGKVKAQPRTLKAESCVLMILLSFLSRQIEIVERIKSAINLKDLQREQMVGKSTSAIRICAILMASLFALSASFQLDDPDWYFWFPLYTCGCIVNLVNGLGKSHKIIRPLAKFALGLGLFLFIKVVIEDLWDGISGIWSLDTRERVVREKIGSGLVIGSMTLQLKAPVSRGRKQKSAKHFEYGMAILVGMGYSLSILFYLCHQKEMKF